MAKTGKIAAALLLSLAAVVVWTRVAVAEASGSAGGSATDSPYKNGPPPVTGGYTDTSRGGTKTSGDPQAAPASSGGQDKAMKSGQPNGSDARKGEPKPEKAPGGDSRS